MKEPERLVIDFDNAVNAIKENEAQLSKVTSKSNIYVFGAGWYGKRITEYYSQRGIITNGFVVDDEFLEINRQNNKANIISLSEAAEKESVGIIYGVGDYYSEKHFISLDRINKALAKCNDYSLYVPSDYWMVEMGELNHEFISIDYVKKHLDEFNETYMMLEDDLSKKIMRTYLYACIIQNSYKMTELATDLEHDYNLELLFEGVTDGLVIEGGAFDGKSIVQMSEYTNNKLEMIALECGDENYRKCCEKTEDYSNIKVTKLGVWSKRTVLQFIQNGSSSHIEEVSDNERVDQGVEVTDIDSLADGRKVSAIALDIEGSEIYALEGARKAIKDGANLAVRLYHKKDDFIVLPQFIKKLNDKYKFYIRYNYGANGTRTGIETTLYAVL